MGRAGYRIAELKLENDELKEKLKGFENGEVAWQGDMDATIKQNLELKAQIEKMKCCQNCKYKTRPETKESILFCIKCKQLDENKENILLTKWELAE